MNMFAYFLPLCVCSYLSLQVFGDLQLEAEWSVNAGNWLQFSCSAFFQSPLPCYCPVNVGKKIDPTGEYVR